MILDIAIGDSYGRAFEFNSKEFIKQFNTGLDYVLRPDEESELMGVYTDDTQMSLALAEHLIDDNVDWSLDNLAERFVKTYIRDPHPGYSKRIVGAIEESAKYKKQVGRRFFNACQLPVIVDSNGSIMRSVPLGILPTEGHVIRAAQIQSLITHCSPAASMGSQLIALTAHYFYYRKHMGDYSPTTYLQYLEEHNMFEYYMICENAFEEYYSKNKTIPCDANITVGAVINTLFISKSTKDILINAIGLSGDVDSIAAITLGIASLKDNVIVNYSRELINNLENNDYGKDYLINIDKEILKKYPREII